MRSCTRHLAIASIALLFAAAPLFATTTARADAPPGLRGVEVMLRPAMSGTPPDSPVRFIPGRDARSLGEPGALLDGATAWNHGFLGQVSVGYRVRPHLSVGIHGGYRAALGKNLDDGSTSLLRNAWSGGFYIRLYPLASAGRVARYIDPWVGVAFGYQRDEQSYRKTMTIDDVANVAGRVSIVHHAVAIPVTLGFDVRVTRFLSIGPSFSIELDTPIAGCFEASAAGHRGASYCSNGDAGKTFVEASTYFAWSGGLDVRFTF